MSDLKMRWCEKLKELLLYLLDNDPDVKQKVSDVALSGSAKATVNSGVATPKDDSKKIIETLRAEKQTLESEITNLRNGNTYLSAELTRERSDKATAIKKQKSLSEQLESSGKIVEKLQREEKNLEDELRICKDKLKAASALEEQYSLYKTLPDNLRKSLSGIVNEESFAKFLISGSQESRQELFWDFCRTEVQKSNGLAHAEILKKLFIFFNDNVSSITSSPIYELYCPPIQSEYKADAMIPSNSGEQSGAVVQVVLPGIKGIRTGNIVKKAIVKLED